MLLEITNWGHGTKYVYCEVVKENKRSVWVYVPRFKKYIKTKYRKLFEEYFDIPKKSWIKVSFWQRIKNIIKIIKL